MRDYDVTSAGVSSEQERNHRMKVYFFMMAIRMACVFSLIWVRGWWVLLAALGGVFLPYLAVVLANQPKNTATPAPERPESLELTGAEPQVDTSKPFIVVDEPADRRSTATSQPINSEVADSDPHTTEDSA